MSRRAKSDIIVTTSGTRNGFTLVELMISIAVITLLAGMAAQTFRAVLVAREIAITRLEISETGRSALDYLASELQSAYLTPDSVKPIVSNVNTTNAEPRFRFAGISRDLTTEDYPDIPGAGKDDDGDGMIDEEVLDGVDGDYPNGAVASLRNVKPQPDPLGCEAGDSACVDEDLGLVPSDIIHFVSAVESSGNIVLQEISYGLDPSGTKLIRRAQVLDVPGDLSGTDLQKMLDFGQFIDNTTMQRLLPPPVSAGQKINNTQVQQAIANWDMGSKYGQLSTANTTNKNVGKLFQVLAYDIRGLRFRYWYYDYNRGGWRYAREWDSSRETAFLAPTENLFNYPAANNSTEGTRRGGFPNLIVNEIDDMYPRVPGSPTRFLIENPLALMTSPDYVDVQQRIVQRTDGLPDMIEITLYVQDRERTRNPKQFNTRVFIPNNYRSIGT